MNSQGRIVRLTLFVLLGSLMMVSPAQTAVSCHKINAKGVGQDLDGGNTQAQIIGGGLLHGTTEAHFEITGGAFPVFAIAGMVTFTTHQGSLTVSVVGTFNVATGDFSASGPVTGATGKLAGATGELSLEGLENLADGTFLEDVTGEICVDLAP
jgi:hypothetical protein